VDGFLVGSNAPDYTIVQRVKSKKNYVSKQLAAIWKNCIMRNPLAHGSMTYNNCATPHYINEDNAA